jgi:hypothetical protein
VQHMRSFAGETRPEIARDRILRPEARSFGWCYSSIRSVIILLSVFRALRATRGDSFPQFDECEGSELMYM